MGQSMLPLFALFLLFLSGTPVSAYHAYDTWFQKWCKQTTRWLPSSEREDSKQQYPEGLSSLLPAEQLLQLPLHRNRKFDARQRREKRLM